MIRLTLAAAAALAFTTSAFAHDIGDYPKTAADLEYCVKARLDSDIDVPYGCRTLTERFWMAVAEEAKK